MVLQRPVELARIFVKKPSTSVPRALHRFHKMSSRISPRLRQAIALLVAIAFVFSPIVSGPLAVTVGASPIPGPAGGVGGAKNGGCNLNSAKGEIQHVIYIQFDNVHFTRDNPNVPSDLEQMPNLLNFITNNGTLMTNHHTPLKSHTADDPNFFMITPDGKNATAPWIPWTQAGCNVGAASIANIELENILGDIDTVFGPGSPEAT
jgi:hypothetical protein